MIDCRYCVRRFHSRKARQRHIGSHAESLIGDVMPDWARRLGAMQEVVLHGEFVAMR